MAHGRPVPVLGRRRCLGVLGWASAVLLGCSWAGMAGAQSQEGGYAPCPRDALTRMLESSVDHREVADVAAIEREVLGLCHTRQELIVSLVEGERRLAELRGVQAAERAPEPQLVVDVPEVMPLPERVRETEDSVEAEAESVAFEPDTPPEPVAVRELATATPAALRWTTVYGSAGDWIAGITDGVEVWYVRRGDALPTGERIVSVRVRPPAVWVGRNGNVWQLPGPGHERGREGGAPQAHVAGVAPGVCGVRRRGVLVCALIRA